MKSEDDIFSDGFGGIGPYFETLGHVSVQIGGNHHTLTRDLFAIKGYEEFFTQARVFSGVEQISKGGVRGDDRIHRAWRLIE